MAGAGATTREHSRAPRGDGCLVPGADPARVAQARAALLAPDVYQALAATFRALADPTRATIAYSLLRQELCTCDLAAILGASEPAVSQHLRVLRELRLVKSRRAGKLVFYSLDDAHIRILLSVWSAGVVLGGAIILLTGWYPADPLISLGIAVLIAKGAWDILRETVDILMEATPRHLNVPQLVGDLLRVPGVGDVHDLHIWTIAGGLPMLSAHVQVVDDRPLSDCADLLDAINGLLAARYHIPHTTIQFECASCLTPALYCTLTAPEDGARAHDHAHAH